MSKEQESNKAQDVKKTTGKTTIKVVKSSSDESVKKPTAKKPAAKKPAAKKPVATKSTAAKEGAEKIKVVTPKDKKEVTEKSFDKDSKISPENSSYEIVLVDSKDEVNSLKSDLKESSTKKPRTVKSTSNNDDNETVVEEKIEEVDIILEEDQEEVPFDWEAYESTSVKRSEDAIALEKMYEDTLMTSLEHQLVSGKVVNLSERDVIIDINSKSEGVVSLNEFRYNPDLKVGDVVEVLVDKQEDKLGQLVLSHRKARSIKAWDRVNEAFDTEEIVQGFVKCRTKGGMIVDIFGLEAFLPGSQIDVKPIRDYDVYVEKTMEFKIVKINHEFKNVVVSHKALIEADLEEQKKVIIGQLEKGQVLEGIVKNITSYGVFICLLYTSDAADE